MDEFITSVIPEIDRMEVDNTDTEMSVGELEEQAQQLVKIKRNGERLSKLVDEPEKFLEYWFSMKFTTSGKPRANSITNCALAFKFISGDLISYNELYFSIFYGAERISDSIVAELAHQTEQLFEFTPAKSTRRDAVFVLGQYNKYNPARQWLESLEWDGVDRLSTAGFYWDTDDTELNHAIASLIIRGMVSRVIYPGCKFPYMPMIVGSAGGEGKSESLEILAGEYYGMSPDLAERFITKKQIREESEGKILLEWAEAQVTYLVEDKVKRLATTKAVALRDSHKEFSSERPVNFIIVGTANAISLSATGGNRRFTILKVNKAVDLEGLQKDRDQLLAQAVTLASKDVILPRHLWSQALADTSLYEDKSEIEEILESISEEAHSKGYGRISTTLIAQRLGIRSRYTGIKGKIRRKLGYEISVTTINGVSQKIWVCDEHPHQNTQVYTGTQIESKIGAINGRV